MHKKAIPPEFCRLERGNKILVLRKDLAEDLVRLGVENPWDWVKSSRSDVQYYSGRTDAAAITLPLEQGLRVVLKRYHHGGLMGRFQKDRYLFSFLPLREMATTRFAQDQKVPVPEILAAVQERVGIFFYRVDLVTRHLPSGDALGDYFNQNYQPYKWEEKKEILHQVGKVVRNMHDAGVFHADLHLKNIYMSNGNGKKDFYILDFDKAHVVPNLSDEMRRKNLIRLGRYVEKYFAKKKIFTRSDQMVFLRAYFGSKEKAREFAKKFGPRFNHHVQTHQILWKNKFATKDWWGYILIKGVVTLLSFMPKKIAYGMAALLGQVAYGLDKKHRKRVMYNLDLIYGDQLSKKEKKIFTRRHFQHLATFMAEVTLSLSWREKERAQYLIENEYVGEENFREGLRRGKGILFLVSHIGNWENLSLVGKNQPCTVYALAKAIKNPWIDRWISQIRRNLGIHVITSGRMNREILKKLAQNNVVAFLVDQNPGARGKMVSFMGKKAPTNTAPAYFALKSGATVIPAYAIRKKPGRFKVVLEPPLKLIHKEDFHEAVLANTALFAENLEKVVRQYPEQWFWVHNRWKVKSPK